jgi:hypothetical protein
MGKEIRASYLSIVQLPHHLEQKWYNFLPIRQVVTVSGKSLSS